MRTTTTIARPLIGASAAMQTVHHDIEMAARTDAKVLITGETGVGKEAVAHTIHERSRRHTAPFVEVNCAGVPDSLLESEFFGHVRGSFTDAIQDRSGLLFQANNGTVFMDEVGEMSLRMQALLLRFLESGEIQAVGGGATKKHADVRVITATNRDLPAAVEKREFREDLYYRLHVLHVHIPPLRERLQDVPLLTDYYLDVFARQHQKPKPVVSQTVLDVMIGYRWPGNVRELRNVVERLVVRSHGETIEFADLPSTLSTRSLGTEGAKGPDSDPMLPHSQRVEQAVDRLFARRESFWTAVYRDYMLRDLTRDDVRSIIRLGLERTHGSYRGLVDTLNMPPADYKRFMSFLKQHDCHLPFQQFRSVGHIRRAQPTLFPDD